MAQASGLFLLLGDPHRVLPAARKLIDELIPASSQATDLDIIDGAGDGDRDSLIARLTEACAQVGMFSGARCVWLREPSIAAAEALLEVIADGLPDRASVVVSARSLDKRSKAAKALLKLAEVRDLGLASGRQGRLEGGEVERLIAERVEANGLPAPAAATVRAILGKAGGSIGELLGEVDRLCLLVDSAAGLDRATVAREMRDQAEAWVFDLTDAISKRRRAEAESLIEDLAGRGEPAPRIVGLLSNQIGELCAASQALDGLGRPRLERNIPGFSAGTYTRLPKKLQSRWKRPARAFFLMQGAAAFTTAELTALNRDLLAVDTALKSSRLEPLQLLSRFLARACGRPQPRIL